MSSENICNICGSNYVYDSASGKWKCPACGAYKPEEISNEETTLLYAASQKLRLTDFDEAEKAFEDIVSKYPCCHMAYWGRLLSRYGIKYEEDFDGRKIPTCYATSIRSFMSDPDYIKACELCDQTTKDFYVKQAEYIERVRKEWVDKASKEKPYDIFICYKDSDLERGVDRTKDSVEAQELYIHLKDQGYRVFYSRESLRDKVGEKYEPYIFSALSSAKVMIVYGSNPNYIRSTWLKNEWMRYLKRMNAGDKKKGSLIVVCDGFSPSELPGVLSNMQCMDAGKKTFYIDLDKAVKYLLREEKNEKAKPAAAQAKEVKTEPEISKVKSGKIRELIVWLAVIAVIGGIAAIGIPKIKNKYNLLYREVDGGYEVYCSDTYEANDVLTIPDKYNGKAVVSIAEEAFLNHDEIKSAALPAHLVTIGKSAFSGCSNLTEVDIPDTVESIGEHAFAQTALKTVYIPDSVEYMGGSVFYRCSSLSYIYLCDMSEIPAKWETTWNSDTGAEYAYAYLCTLDYSDCTTVGNVSEQYISSKDEFVFPVPTKFGYVFMGWEYNEKLLTDCNGNYNHTVPIYSAMTVKPKWILMLEDTVTIRELDNSDSKLITDMSIFDEKVTFQLNVNDLKNNGYHAILLNISYNCSEICDGYQVLSICSTSGFEFANFKGEHGTDKALADQSWDSHSFHTLVSLDDLGDNCEIYLKWTADGKGIDSWKLGFTKINAVVLE